MNELLTLPSQIEKIVDVNSTEEVHIGESKSRVFRVTGKSGEAYYLKVSESEYVNREIEQEVQILKWLLKQSVPAPRAITIEVNEKQTFFLMTEVPGNSIAELAPKLGLKDCMRLGAVFLKDLHQLDIADCPFDRRLEVTRRLAYNNLNDRLVDETDFDSENLGKSAEQLFSELKWDLKEDVVFTHGDYCFPNIICQKDRVTGVVDLGRAGLADRYQDIALFLRSFKFNVGEPDINLFLECYGLIDRVDNDKITFFKKLDEFF